MSHQNVSRWTGEIGKSIKRNESGAAHFECYSLVVDENTDATDTTQLTIFIRDIGNEYRVTEEMAFLMPLKDWTKSIICTKQKKKNTLKLFSLTFVNISGISTDGAPAMVWWTTTASDIKKIYVWKL